MSSEDIIKQNNDNVTIENFPNEKITDRKYYKIKNSRIKKSTVYSAIFFLITLAYFIWATYYYFKNNEPWASVFNKTTCDGYGLLVILYVLYYWSLIYYKILKPFCLPKVRKHFWKPLRLILNRIPYGSYIFYILFLAVVAIYLFFDTQSNRERLIPLVGLVVFLVVAYLVSSKKSRIPWHTVAWGMILQFIFGLLTIRWEPGRNIFQCIGDKATTFFSYAFEAATFTYGDFLVNQEAVFAFRALSSIFLTSFVVNILYFYGAMQKFIKLIGEFLQYIMGTSICESVNSAANIILGMSEGALMIKPYLKDLTDSEINSIMTSGFATVSGSTLAAYVEYGARSQDLITASIMSAPAALCFSKLIVPEVTEVKVDKNSVKKIEIEYDSVLDAAAHGAASSASLVAGIISGVMGFLAFVYFINGILGWLGILVGFDGENTWTLDLIMGKIFIPLAWVMGVPWEECEKVAQIIGVKTMVNEFVAFERMSHVQLTPRTKVITTYAICGFANPGSVGIMMSTIASLAPNKRDGVARVVFSSFLGGSLVCFATACLAGILMPDDALG